MSQPAALAIRPLLFPARRLAFVTDASFVEALLARNHFPRSLRVKTIRMVQRFLKEHGRGTAMSEVLQILDAARTRAAPRQFNKATAHLGSCASCTKAIPPRWACRLCALGLSLQQDPHLSSFVCRRRRMFIGPGVDPTAQCSVGPRTMRADQIWQRLLARGEADLSVMLELERLIRDCCEQRGLRLDHVERFTRMVFMWSAVVASSAQLTDSTRVFASRYELLRELVLSAWADADEEPIPIVDGLWAMLRHVAWRRTLAPASAQRAQSVRTEGHWPHDAAILRVPSGSAAESFDGYLAPMRTCRSHEWVHFMQLYAVERARTDVRWDVRPGSGDRVLTVCPKGHSSSVLTNLRRDTFRSKYMGCAVCSGHVALKGSSSLADLKPQVAERWHPTRNGELTPHMVTQRTDRKVWWQCVKGHEFEAVVSNMSRKNGTPCPLCNRSRVIVGENGLDVTHPEIAALWHPALNGDLGPSQVLSGSGKRAWWQCESGHDFEAQISSIVSGNRCPVCANRKIIPGINSLADVQAEIAAQWHPTRNDALRPTMVAPRAALKVWWICGEGHEWSASIASRAEKGCPVCADLLVVRGVNSLEDTHPEIAPEWVTGRNDGLEPWQVVSGSPAKRWWRCPLGHEYQQVVQRRTTGRGCHYCGNSKVLPGFNDAATRFPKLMADWDWARNADFDPTMRLPGGQRHHWVCAKGHRAFSAIPPRHVTRGCTECPLEERSGFNQ